MYMYFCFSSSLCVNQDFSSLLLETYFHFLTDLQNIYKIHEIVNGKIISTFFFIYFSNKPLCSISAIQHDTIVGMVFFSRLKIEFKIIGIIVNFLNFDK